LVKHVKPAQTAFLRYYTVFIGVDDTNMSVTEQDILEIVFGPFFRNAVPLEHADQLLKQITAVIVYQRRVLAVDGGRVPCGVI
jgi:hypothetical protein